MLRAPLICAGRKDMPFSDDEKQRSLENHIKPPLERKEGVGGNLSLDKQSAFLLWYERKLNVLFEGDKRDSVKSTMALSISKNDNRFMLTCCLSYKRYAVFDTVKVPGV